jgi:sulfide:quinone oxidoreductase
MWWGRQLLKLMTMAAIGGSRNQSRDDEGFRVLIAGGGIAALEAILALRELLGRRPQIELVAPDSELVYRALAVGEPFGMGEARRIPLDRVAADLGFAHHQDVLEQIDPRRRTVATAAGAELNYDALLVAVGARAGTGLPGALTYSGPESNPKLRALLDSLRAGDVRRFVFAVAPAARWPLPLYELAVLTARYARRHGVDAEVSLVTHETAPLELFGPRASEGVRQLLAIEGVGLRASAAPAAVKDGALRLASGEALDAEAVVTLPRFVAPPISGLPQGPDGFVDTDVFMRIDGLDAVWAAGDVTWFPIKQGGLAAQQADAAASGIAHRIDPAVEMRPFAPVLRGALLTGWTPHYLRAQVGRPADGSSDTTAPLWWPPSKVAGRLLAPYLARLSDLDRRGRELVDLGSPDGAGPQEREDDHRDALELALTAADLDARQRDYAAALRWLEVAEHLNLALPSDYAGKRERWAAQRRMQRSGAR